MNVDRFQAMKTGGRFLLIDRASQRFFSVSPTVHAVLGQLRQGKSLDMMEIGAELKRTVRSIIDGSPGSESAVQSGEGFNLRARRYVERLHLIRPSFRDAIFMVAQDCNMACTYCYGGESGRFRSRGELMQAETASECLSYFVANHGAIKIQNVSFMGGEPLLNFPVMVHLLEQWKSMKAQYPGQEVVFGITTNATLLTTEIVRFLKKNNLIVWISLDGPRCIHDRHRVFRNHEGSYDKVMAGIELLRSQGVTFSIRGTITRQTDLRELESFSRSAGFDTEIYTTVDSPFVEKQREYQFDLEEYRRINRLFRDYYRKAAEDLKAGRKSTFNLKLFGVQYGKVKRMKTDWPLSCGAGWFLISFDTGGTIYPCHQLIGRRGYEIGTCASGMDKRRVQELYSKLLDSCESCDSCWLVPFCKGGCMVEKAGDPCSFRPADERICKASREHLAHTLDIIAELQEFAAAHEIEDIFEPLRGYNVL